MPQHFTTSEIIDYDDLHSSLTQIQILLARTNKDGVKVFVLDNVYCFIFTQHIENIGIRKMSQFRMYATSELIIRVHGDSVEALKIRHYPEEITKIFLDRGIKFKYCSQMYVDAE